MDEHQEFVDDYSDTDVCTITNCKSDNQGKSAGPEVAAKGDLDEKGDLAHTSDDERTVCSLSFSS